MSGGGDWVRMWGVNVGSGGVRNKCNVGECTRWEWLSMEHVAPAHLLQAVIHLKQEVYCLVGSKYGSNVSGANRKVVIASRELVGKSS